MTRSEIEAQQRSVRRHCKGPFRLTEQEKKDLLECWSLVATSKDIPAAKGIVMAIEVYVDSGHKPLPDDWDVVLGRFQDLLDLRRKEGCGYNFNDFILSHPFDGHDYGLIYDDENNLIADRRTPCPWCGILISWKAPLYEVDDDS